jgi:hypothetical protein
MHVSALRPFVALQRPRNILPQTGYDRPCSGLEGGEGVVGLATAILTGTCVITLSPLCAWARLGQPRAAYRNLDQTRDTPYLKG